MIGARARAQVAAIHFTSSPLLVGPVLSMKTFLVVPRSPP